MQSARDIWVGVPQELARGRAGSRSAQTLHGSIVLVLQLPVAFWDMKARTIPIQTNNPRPWQWPLLLLAGVTLPILWLLPVLWSRSVTLGILVAFVALPGLALAGILASWLVRWPGLLVYEVTGRGLTIHTHQGPVQIVRSEVRQARALQYALRWNPRSFGHLPGYYVGAYTLPEVGLLTAYVAQPKGQGVLLELKNGEKILLSPQDPAEVLRLFR